MGAASQGNAGIGAGVTLGLNFITNTIEATVSNTTTRDGSAGDVRVKAEESSMIFAFAGGFAKGKNLGLGGINRKEHDPTAALDGIGKLVWLPDGLKTPGRRDHIAELGRWRSIR